jgi:hypothetical protein
VCLLLFVCLIFFRYLLDAYVTSAALSVHHSIPPSPLVALAILVFLSRGTCAPPTVSTSAAGGNARLAQTSSSNSHPTCVGTHTMDYPRTDMETPRSSATWISHRQPCSTLGSRSSGRPSQTVDGTPRCPCTNLAPGLNRCRGAVSVGSRGFQRSNCLPHCQITLYIGPYFASLHNHLRPCPTALLEGPKNAAKPKPLFAYCG